MLKIIQHIHTVNAVISVCGVMASLMLGDHLFAINYILLMNTSLLGVMAIQFDQNNKEDDK